MQGPALAAPQAPPPRNAVCGHVCCALRSQCIVAEMRKVGLSQRAALHAAALAQASPPGGCNSCHLFCVPPGAGEHRDKLENCLFPFWQVGQAYQTGSQTDQFKQKVCGRAQPGQFRGQSARWRGMANSMRP